MDFGLILSSSTMHGKYLPWLLAKKLDKAGIPVLLTHICWPRDELFIYPDGNCDYIQKDTCQYKFSRHFAWNGGTYLRGSDFIIGSLTANPEEKQNATHKALGVKEGFYFDISSELDSLKNIKVNNADDFFRADFPHIDIIYNIGNSRKALFTYDHPRFIETGEKMEELTGYNLITIPLEEARFAGIGFVEFGDKCIVDRRAKKTKRILEDIGYEVITTPFGLKKTNDQLGSLHCMTTEMPIELERIIMMHPDKARDTSQKIELDQSLLYNLKGEKAMIKFGSYKLQFKY